MTFNVRDKVTAPGITGDEVREVLYGPYRTFEGSGERYLISTASGFAATISAEALVASPKFKVGDKVHAKIHDENVEIVYGPYLSWDGEQHVLTKNAEGVHRHPALVDIQPITKPVVGDCVRVVKEDRSGIHTDYVGKVGIVTNFDEYDDNLPWKVKLNDGGYAWVYEIEKI